LPEDWLTELFLSGITKDEVLANPQETIDVLTYHMSIRNASPSLKLPIEDNLIRHQLIHGAANENIPDNQDLFDVEFDDLDCNQQHDNSSLRVIDSPVNTVVKAVLRPNPKVPMLPLGSVIASIPKAATPTTVTTPPTVTPTSQVKVTCETIDCVAVGIEAEGRARGHSEVDDGSNSEATTPVHGIEKAKTIKYFDDVIIDSNTSSYRIPGSGMPVAPDSSREEIKKQIYAEVTIKFESYQENYRVISKLGHGSFGIVYRAHDKKANKDVALKIISLRHAGKIHIQNAKSGAMDNTEAAEKDESTPKVSSGRDKHCSKAASQQAQQQQQQQEKSSKEVDMLMYEIGIMNYCRHPNIVSLLNAFCHEGEVCIALEYMDLGKITDVLIANMPVPEPMIVYTMKMVLRAISHMHRHHKLHRDIKSDNILIDRYGQVKIADFGFATSLASDRTTCMSLAGTPCW
jgi:hypothetical protein